jgi:hypothetical protein
LDGRRLPSSLTISATSKEREGRNIEMLDFNPSFYFPPQQVGSLENFGLLETG